MSPFRPWLLCVFAAPTLGACLSNSISNHADLAKSTLTAPTLNLPSDGVSDVPVTVTVRRGSGQAVAGVSVQVAVDKCMVTQPAQPTSAAGEAIASVRCLQPGQRTVSASIAFADLHADLECTLTLNVLDSNAPVGSVPTDAPLNVQVNVPSAGKPYTGTIHFVSSDPDATLPPDYTFTAGDNGVRVLVNAVVLRTPGSQTVQAIDTATGRIVYSQTFWVVDTAATTGSGAGGGSSSGSTTAGSSTAGGSTASSTTGGSTAASTSTTGGSTGTGSGTSTTGGASAGSTTGAPHACHEVGGSAYVATSSTGPATQRLGDIVLDASGRPMLASLNNISATNVYVQVFDGSSWVGLAGSNAGTGITGRTNGVMMSPAITTLSNGAPAVSWLTQAGTGYNANYLFWDGSAWAYLGTSKQVYNTLSSGGAATLSVNSNNVPFVAWERSSASLVARAWDGNDWTGLSSQAQTLATSILPSAGVGADDAPVLAWVDQTESGSSKIFVGHYAGGAWTAFGGSLSGGGLGSGTAPALAMDVNDRPVVAWDNGNNIYLLAWSGSAWQALGGSASGNGISGNTSGGAHHPTVAVDGDNHPVVAWEDTASQQIYLRRFDGMSWVDDGGASGQGASAAASAALWPRLRVAPGQAPVLYWQETSATTRLHVCSWY